MPRSPQTSDPIAIEIVELPASPDAARLGGAEARAVRAAVGTLLGGRWGPAEVEYAPDAPGPGVRLRGEAARRARHLGGDVVAVALTLGGVVVALACVARGEEDEEALALAAAARQAAAVLSGHLRDRA